MCFHFYLAFNESTGRIIALSDGIASHSFVNVLLKVFNKMSKALSGEQTYTCMVIGSLHANTVTLTLLHLERPKLYAALAFLSAIVLMMIFFQGSHFDLIYPAAEKVGWLNRNVARVEHVAFGVVLGEDK